MSMDTTLILAALGLGVVSGISGAAVVMGIYLLSQRRQRGHHRHKHLALSDSDDSERESDT